MLKRIKELLSRRGRKPSAADAADGAAPAEAPQPRVQVGPRVVHNPIPVSDLDPDAVKIVQRLTRFDHSAYLVGGCVRDLLLGKRPKDFDIGTSATPRQIKRLFRNSRIIGRRFRLAHIYFQQGKIIEVATFRAQNGEDDGDRAGSDLLIREDNQFGTPEEDALRRDFTVNSLFYDVNRETVLDHADGLGDLRRRLIRTIGDPEVRFREDPIRILRAIKFAARLDFEIEPGTLEALRRARHEIPKAAAPRILEELNRFCRGGAARRSFELMRRHGVFEIVLPEIAPHYDEREESWKLLGALLDEMDRRQRDGQAVSTGVIFAALLLPVVREELGWVEDGQVRPPKGVDVRALADPVLRPLAVRLRVSRKDQETCRQILLTLFRMVPPRKARRNTRRSILRRECFADAVWILGALGRALGGEFPAAHQHWSRAAESAAGPPPAARRREPKPADAEPPKAAEAGAGRRRRSRGHRGGAKGGQEPRPAPGPRKEGGKEMPPPWDDDYFFAALPSVPRMKGDDKQGDRYGAAAVAAASAPEPQDEAPEETGAESRPKRKRRPRRRRRRPAGSDGEDTGGNEGSGD